MDADVEKYLHSSGIKLYLVLGAVPLAGIAGSPNHASRNVPRSISLLENGYLAKFYRSRPTCLLRME